MAERVEVGPGDYAPQYAPAGERIAVPAFRLDTRAVTRGEFEAFVLLHPQWQRGRAPSLFAEEAYLGDWDSATSAGGLPNQPVTNVSWHAARAFCKARGARLPTEAEWELAAAADASRPDARKDPAFNQLILDWYGRSAQGALPEVPHGEPNYWGVTDLHGVIWEWVEDYNAALVDADQREGGSGDVLQFCGVAGAKAAAPEDYAAFMRSAFRSSLQSHYATATLGFRCAADREDR